MLSRIFIAALIALFVCTNARADPETIWPTRGWQTSTPEDQGMDSTALARLVETGQSKNADSILIVRHGKIVLDAYYAPYTAELPHVINSVTKSVVGTLAAIAIKDGLLPGTDQPVLPFFAARGVVNLDDAKKSITLQHLLDMTSGLDWQEVFDKTPQSAIDMELSQNWVDFILNRPMAASPGERFNYNSGNPHLVSAILTQVTGMSTEDYARAKLFGPLGITDWKWRRDPQGILSGGFGLVLHPQDMAKLGYLYLHHGEWDGRQLLPADWTDRISRAAVDMKLTFAPAWRYSNFFWADPGRDVYWASGFHCQLVLVYPALNIVAVTTARDNCGATQLIPAIAAAATSQTALPPDPAGTVALATAIRAAATEKASESNVVSPLAAAVSGKVYQFPRNAMTVKSMFFVLVGDSPFYDFEFYSRDRARPPERYSGALGLDGLYRRGMDTAFGPLSIKGRWLDDHVFELERLNIGASEKARKWMLTFEGDKLTLNGKNFIGNDVTVTGVRSQ